MPSAHWGFSRGFGVPTNEKIRVGQKVHNLQAAAAETMKGH